MSNIGVLNAQVQQESVQYQAPVSESALSAMGGAINFSLTRLLPIGTVIPSMLTQAQVDSEFGAGYWLLCNGQTCAGTDYAALTGNSTVPNFFNAIGTVTPWTAFTPTSNLTNTISVGKYRRVGDTAEISVGILNNFAQIGNGSNVFQLNLPPGLTINTTKLGLGPYAWQRIDGNAHLRSYIFDGSTYTEYAFEFSPMYYGTSSIQFEWDTTENNYINNALRNPVTQGFFWLLTSPSSYIEFTTIFRVPISGWSSTEQNYFIRVKR